MTDPNEPSPDHQNPAPVFGAAAPEYARYRPGIPAEAVRLLAQTLAGVAEPVLLDLGTGTGQVPLALLEVQHLAQVDLVDSSRAQLSQALEELLPRLGAAHMSQFVGRAEDFRPLSPDYQPHLITCCRSFHWMNRPAVLAMGDRYAAPGAVFAVMGDGSLWTHDAEWTRAVRELIQRYLGDERRAGAGAAYAEPGRSYVQELADSAWSEVTEHRFPVTRSWTPRTVLGYLRTTSFAGAELFGPRHAEFEKEAHALLHEHAAGGEELTEETVFTVLLARRPGDTR